MVCVVSRVDLMIDLEKSQDVADLSLCLQDLFPNATDFSLEFQDFHGESVASLASILQSLAEFIRNHVILDSFDIDIAGRTWSHNRRKKLRQLYSTVISKNPQTATNLHPNQVQV